MIASDPEGSTLEMILLDWTRMGNTYCLGGALTERGRIQIIRPLLTRFRNAPVRNVGWSAYVMDGHARWEIFELVGPSPAVPQPPHLEDLWVRSLSSRKMFASPEQRRAILKQTVSPAGEPIFGVPLATTRSAAYLLPDTGQRSLTTVIVPAGQILFEGIWRAGAAEPDIRVRLPVAELKDRLLPVKDHHLLRRSDSAGADPRERAKMLNLFIQHMDGQIAVRLGLSRPYQSSNSAGSGLCWVMADGFFSLSNPHM